MAEERFEVSYHEPDVEKEIPDLSGKVIESAKVVHEGSEGYVTLRFADGVVKRFGYNDLAFWEERPGDRRGSGEGWNENR